jgi:hypothetical protein
MRLNASLYILKKDRSLLLSMLPSSERNIENAAVAVETCDYVAGN